MTRYRKKPIEIEAVQFTGDNWEEIREFTGGDRHVTSLNTESGCIQINTLEGMMFAMKGDYIIKGVKGEFYPCKPDIFDETYEEVKE